MVASPVRWAYSAMDMYSIRWRERACRCWTEASWFQKKGWVVEARGAQLRLSILSLLFLSWVYSCRFVEIKAFYYLSLSSFSSFLAAAAAARRKYWYRQRSDLWRESREAQLEAIQCRSMLFLSWVYRFWVAFLECCSCQQSDLRHDSRKTP